MTDGAMTMSGVYAQPHHRPCPSRLLDHSDELVKDKTASVHRLSYSFSLPTASYNLVATSYGDRDERQTSYGRRAVSLPRHRHRCRRASGEDRAVLLNPLLCRVCGGTGREPRSKHPEG